ncbi:TetR/AcrR family transcriptional regulator [Gordonia lacunae]|uniref:TetR/AcrR family transcriptional regulator n=1 Tax=Gordonia lacunae TaxID=417102 RepID=UPI0039E5CBE6
MSTEAWAKRSPERRQKILEAVISVIAELGLEAATTRRVANRAGVALGSVHYVFASKAEMIAGAIDFVAEAIDAALRPVVIDALSGDADVAEAITVIVQSFWDFVEADPGFQLMQYELTLYCLRRPDHRWLAARQYDRYRDVVAHTLRVAEEHTGELLTKRQIDELSRQAVAGLDGIILQFLVHGSSEQAAHDVAVLASNLVAVYGPAEL